VAERPLLKIISISMQSARRRPKDAGEQEVVLESS
jgi:hypothetical protein